MGKRVATEDSKDVGMPTSLGLKKRVVGYYNMRKSAPRSHGFHPSGLSRLCPIKFYLYEQAREGLGDDDASVRAASMERMRTFLDTKAHNAGPGGRFGGGLYMEFRTGHALHRGAQFQLGVIGKLWGKWECTSCKIVRSGYMPRAMFADVKGNPTPDAAPCIRCHGQNLRNDIPWDYIEPSVPDNKWGITGHTDGILHINRGGSLVKVLLEIKSISEAGYTEKLGQLPKSDHVEQASMYAHLFGVDYIQFIYISKNATRNWKEYLVELDRRAVDVNLKKIDAVNKARKTKELPLFARVCESIHDPKARGCPVVEECFGEKPGPSFWE